MTLERHPQVSRAFGTELVPIDSVQPHPRNYREHDVGAISELLTEYGQTKPIIVQALRNEDREFRGFIVAGSGTWKAAKALGWSEIGVRFMDWDDRTAEKYLVADNRAHDLGRNEDELLGELLAELWTADTLDGTGYDADDLDDLLKDTGKIKLPPMKAKTVECPECGARFAPGKKETK